MTEYKERHPRPVPEQVRYRINSSGNQNVIPEFADLSAIALAKAEGEYPGSHKSNYFEGIPAFAGMTPR
ncbi:MAG: hypothetical protein P9L88_05935 [Candidatus Tantalella remota]|nr:hypothetical protein [Candidatus Tantalella remota]